MSPSLPYGTALAALGLVLVPHRALAEEPTWTPQVTYTADITGALDGGAQKAGRALDNLDLILDGDLDKAIGWRGAKLHVYVLNNSGGKPNEVVGSLQGVDNIEVSNARLRLYEAWVEQSLGPVSVLAGLYNLNSEFYTTEASGLMFAPPFGIGSELASTGPNGPSIFPLTSLAVRVKYQAKGGLYGEVAVLNAHAGTLGQPAHMELKMDRGALVIGEAGWRSKGRVAVGAWGYTLPQNDIRDLAADGSPARRESRGVYVLAEAPLAEVHGRALAGFLRAGLSDGDTSPYRGGWQTGLRIDGLVAGRPKSAFSIGLQQGFLSRKQRANEADAGVDVGANESGVEMVFSDTVGRLTIRPDLQIITTPDGDRTRPHAVVGALRLIVALF